MQQGDIVGAFRSRVSEASRLILCRLKRNRYSFVNQRGGTSLLSRTASLHHFSTSPRERENPTRTLSFRPNPYFVGGGVPPAYLGVCVERFARWSATPELPLNPKQSNKRVLGKVHTHVKRDMPLAGEPIQQTCFWAHHSQQIGARYATSRIETTCCGEGLPDFHM